MKENFSVVVVNYKTSSFVLKLFESLPQNFSDRCSDFIVIDNCSGDDSVSEISKWINNNYRDYELKLIVSDVNGGYAYGNNLAIKKLQMAGEMPEFIMFLNPDTVVAENTFDVLINFMKANPLVGIAGSRLISDDGKSQCSSFRFPSILSELASALKLGFIDNILSKWIIAPKHIPSAAERVDWVAGASMIIRREVFNDIGLMDEDYFLYFEETDFCLQAYKKGWECWYVPESVVKHFVGQSTGVVSGDKLRRRRPKYWFESRQRYFLKNHGLFYTMLADITWGVGFAIWRVRRFLQRKPDTDPIYMLRDFWRNSIFFSWIK
jgi:N-acetylglucosaminyl-diphospho-decaprenol L-rhamnosyltransferase